MRCFPVVRNIWKPRSFISIKAKSCRSASFAGEHIVRDIERGRSTARQKVGNTRCRQFTALRRKMKPSITDRAVLNKDLQQRNAAQHLFTLASLIASLEHSVDPIKPRQKMAHLLETSNPSLNTVTLPIKAQPIQKEPDHQLTPRQTSRLDEEVVE